MGVEVKVGDKIRLTGKSWEDPQNEYNAPKKGEVYEVFKLGVDGDPHFYDETHTSWFAVTNPAKPFYESWGAEIVKPERSRDSLKVGDRVRSLHRLASLVSIGDLGTVKMVRTTPDGDQFASIKYDRGTTANGALRKDGWEWSQQYPVELVDEWAEDHQDSLTFRTTAEKTISVGWGQGTKNTPKAQISVQSVTVSLTEDELEVLTLALIKAKEENDKIFKG